VQPVASTAAQALALPFNRIARPSVHPGQEQVVHLDDLVEQRLARLDEVAGDERVALRFGKAPEVPGIVAAPELAELADDPGVTRRLTVRLYVELYQVFMHCTQRETLHLTLRLAAKALHLT